MESVVHDLVALDFPGEDMRDGVRSSGPGYHLCTLRASQYFWERSTEAWEAADAEIETALRELTAALTECWGVPETIELDPLQWYEPEPLSQLSQGATVVAWYRPEAGRWVGLTTLQGDVELPIELCVGVGEGPIPAVEP